MNFEEQAIHLGKVARQLSEELVSKDEELKKLKMELEEYKGKAPVGFKVVGYTSKLTLRRLRRNPLIGGIVSPVENEVLCVPVYIQE